MYPVKQERFCGWKGGILGRMGNRHEWVGSLDGLKLHWPELVPAKDWTQFLSYDIRYILPLNKTEMTGMCFWSYCRSILLNKESSKPWILWVALKTFFPFVLLFSTFLNGLIFVYPESIHPERNLLQSDKGKSLKRKHNRAMPKALLS